MDTNQTRSHRHSPNFTPSSRVQPSDIYHSAKQDSRSYGATYASKPEEQGHEDPLRSKAKKLDEQFMTLVDRCNRSKEYIDNAHRATFQGDARVGSTFVSPTHSSLSGLRRSPNAKYGSGLESTFESTRKPIGSNIKISDYDYDSRGGNQTEYNSSRVEQELQDLKNVIMERLRSPENEPKGTRPDAKKSSRKLKLDELSSSDDEQDESDTRKKASTKTHRLTTSKPSTRTAKSPEPAIRRKKSTKHAEEIEPNDRAKKTVKNVATLKTKFDEREALLKDKYLNLKYKAKEMRSTLQEYVSKCVDMEEVVHKKDQILLEFEDQMKESQQELLRNFEILQETKRNEELLAKSEEELRIQNSEMKIRIQEQKRRLEEIEEQTRRNEDKYHSQMETLQSEKHEVKVDLRDREDKLDHLSIANEKLKSEVDRLQKEIDRREVLAQKIESQNERKEETFRELREKLDALQIENKSLHAKNEDLKENKAYLDDKVAKYKKKIEEDRSKWEDDKEKEFASKKNKNKQLKVEIKELEAVLQKITDEKKTLAIEVERTLTAKSLQEKELSRYREELMLTQQDFKTMRINLDALKEQNDEIMRNYHKESDRATALQTENRKLNKVLKTNEDKGSFKEKELSRSDELNGRLRNELKIVLEEHEKAKEYIVQLESKLEYFRSSQDDQMGKFEGKMNELEREILNVKDENTILRTNEAHLAKELDVLKDERDQYKRDYKALKQVNKNLEKDLREIDERVRDFIHEKQLELHDHNKEVTMHKQLNSKLKVLEDIQTMIKSHRHSHRNKFELSEMI